MSVKTMVALVCLYWSLSIHSSLGGAACRQRPFLFNFGDSNSDTGGASALRGKPLELPEGRTFFHEPTGRICDGRLLLDFLCESVGTKYLSPYLDASSPDFSNGVNFALSTSDTLRRVNPYIPYTLSYQISQFSRFHNTSLRRRSITLIPVVISNIRDAIRTIYGLGGRNFWVHNTGPLGCLPKNVAKRNASTRIDDYGCIAKRNEAAVKFNSDLQSLCQDLRSEMDHDATIVYVDVHSIKLDLILNHTSYGFGDPLTACYNKAAQPQSVCSEAEGRRYVSWDGVHYTEAANMLVASKILSTNYSTPPLNFNFFCN